MISPPTHTFSNGTEGYAWQDVWCDECARDHEAHIGNAEDGCEIIARSLIREPIPEWEDWTEEEGFTFPPAIRCRTFTQCTECDEHSELTDNKGRTHRAWAAQVRAPLARRSDA